MRPLTSPVVVLTAFAVIGVSASAQALEFASQIDGLQITSATDIPSNPAGSPQVPVCFYYPEGEPSAAAAGIGAAGWAVSGEVTQGAMRYVSFVGVVEPGTSGACDLQQGNVAIFRDDALIGLIYTEQDPARHIGTIAGLEPDGIRILSGGYIRMPMAELRIHDDKLALLRPVSETTSFCDGRFAVPTVYGLPIHRARILLLADGWQPRPADSPSPSGWVQSRRDGGLPELHDCAGTGLGYCAHGYSKSGGVMLDVTTAGEGGDGSSPRVVDFGVECE